MEADQVEQRSPGPKLGRRVDDVQDVQAGGARTANAAGRAMPGPVRTSAAPESLRHCAVESTMLGFATVLSCGAVVSVVVALRDHAPGPGELSAQSARPS
ncbi:hypothetical protein [Streptomyces sp. NRRL S-146]|uniref:hypothetical protein n=1 Tax=Streptomyces sp. NRRL S-146 TaxID=1463884 RepID=UPI0004CBF0CA|nr:hypothetical protein [Streptomyces sp. NRRL S-146]